MIGHARISTEQVSCPSSLCRWEIPSADLRSLSLITVLALMRGKAANTPMMFVVLVLNGKLMRFNTLPPHGGHIAASLSPPTPMVAPAAAPSTGIGTPTAPPSRDRHLGIVVDPLRDLGPGQDRAPALVGVVRADVGDHGAQLVGVERHGVALGCCCVSRSARAHVEDTWGLGAN